MNDKTQKIIIYFVILASIILLILNLIELDSNDLSKGTIIGIVSNLLIIIGMIFTLISRKKEH